MHQRKPEAGSDGSKAFRNAILVGGCEHHHNLGWVDAASVVVGDLAEVAAM